MSEQVEYHGQINDISMDQYIKDTEVYRARQCRQYLADIMSKHSVSSVKKKEPRITIPANVLNKRLEMAYMGGELKALETMLNVCLNHMIRRESLDILLGDVQLALTKKLSINNEKFATNKVSDQDAILDRIITLCERAKEEYRGGDNANLSKN